MFTESVKKYPWLVPALERARAALSGGRMPHAILLLANPGLGAQSLAEFIAASVLCQQSTQPCGHCADCRLLTAGHHPDLHRVQREDDAQQIKVDQVRTLIDALSLTSFRAGYKVGLIESAELMNAAAANSLLKTLEEPADNALLILIAARAHRLPATIVSRCQRMVIDTPNRLEAVRWLAEQGVNEADADAALELYRGAPLAALDADYAACAQVARELPATLSALATHRVDPSRVADQWMQGDASLNLAWLENWVTRTIREALGAPAANVKSVDAVGLSASLLKAKIRPLFHLLAEVRRTRRSADSSLNMQLALESLLIRHFDGSKSAI